MALLHEAINEKKLDTRMVERNMARAVIKADDVERSQRELPDDGENADYTSIDALIHDQSDQSESN